MILVDTNVVARSRERFHPHHQAAVDSIAHLRANEREEFAISVHNLYELYFIMTKPVASNGFGFSADQASAALRSVEGVFRVLTETFASYVTWRRLVESHGVVNRPCFDAKIVASMIENQVPRILTFNDKDFMGYSEIKVLNPFDVLGIPRV